MEMVIDLIRKAIEFLFLYPKSTTSLLVLLTLVLAIAFYVNRHRDESGRVSFLDRGRNGVIGARLFRMEEGNRKEIWPLPLWAGERNLLTQVKIFLSKGEYGVNAFWRPDGEMAEADVFTPIADGKETANTISRTARFVLSQDMALTFRLTAADGRLQIDSPDADHLTAEGETPPLPLPIGDSSLTRLARLLQKGKASGLWRLSLQDDRIMKGVQNTARTARRKLDGMAVEKKRLENQLDQAVQKLKAAGPKKKA